MSEQRLNLVMSNTKQRLAMLFGRHPRRDLDRRMSSEKAGCVHNSLLKIWKYFNPKKHSPENVFFEIALQEEHLGINMFEQDLLFRQLLGALGLKVERIYDLRNLLGSRFRLEPNAKAIGVPEDALPGVILLANFKMKKGHALALTSEKDQVGKNELADYLKDGYSAYELIKVSKK